MWQGKNKAVTFSFDDGVSQDIRTIEILNRYGLKGTFNLNSGLLGVNAQLSVGGGKYVDHNKVLPEQVKAVYAGHEVAVHTVKHPNLTTLLEEEIVEQVESDRETLSELCGYPVVGMAYPCGGVNNDARVADVLRRRTPIRYSRTITSTHRFDLQENLLQFNPTVYWVEDCLDEIVDKFLALQTDKPQLLYIWGHSYEADAGYMTWERFERICEKLAKKSDVFYGTNREVLL
jgi:peptidoglycan/xylan/chitin deacetylase (PgdA/CDA1 family)